MPVEASPPQVPAAQGLGLVNKCLPKSKGIQKSGAKAYMSKLCDKFPKVFEEIRECRQGISKLKAQKLAYQKRVKVIMSSSLITEMMESAADDSSPESDESKPQNPNLNFLY